MTVGPLTAKRETEIRRDAKRNGVVWATATVLQMLAEIRRLRRALKRRVADA